MAMMNGIEVLEPNWVCVANAKASVAEIPTWSSEHDGLFWLDLFEPSLNLTGIGRHARSRKWVLPRVAGCFALYQQTDQVIVALSDGLYRLDLDRGDVTKLYDAPYDEANYKFNDGCCDPRGRFWVGSLRLAGSFVPDKTSSYWRLDERGLSREIDGITVSNGTAFSPSGDVMYVADRIGEQILAYDYDVESGRASNCRTFAQVPNGHPDDGVPNGHPDGGIVDADGGYWCTVFGSGVIVRYDRDGSPDRVVRAPSLHSTMATLGGPDLRTMYVTTARRFMDERMLADEPQAGGIFACDVAAVGLPQQRFRG